MARPPFGRLNPALPIGLQIIPEQSQCRLEQRDLNSAALPCSLACVKQGYNATESVHTGHLIDRRYWTAHVAAALVAGHRHDAAEGLQNDALARRIFQWAGATEPGNAAVDQAIVQRPQRRDIDAQPFP